jgi:tetratricopeptide (TPR) repeat protein
LSKSRPRRAAPPGGGRGTLVAIVLILAAGSAAYANSFAGRLVFDDEPALVANTHLRSLWPLTGAMGAPPGTTLSGRPGAARSIAVDYAHAADPLAAYHRTNLLIHLLAALAVFGVVRRTLRAPALAARFATASTPLAAVVALLFAVHPLQTDAVTYVVQRVESLMGLVYLTTLYCAIRAAGSQGRSKTAWSTASVLACALGMGTKEAMASAPLVVMLWDYHFAPAISRRRFYAALASTWIVLAVLVAGGYRSTSVGFGFAEWPWWRYLFTQAGVIVHYLRLAFVPAGLVLDYDWRPATSLAQIAIPGLLVCVLLAATIYGALRRRPWAFAGACCFLILAPTSSVVPIVTDVAAEHRMYLPLAAILAVVVVAIFEAGRRLAGTSPRIRTRAAGAGLLAAAAVTIVFARMTYQRNADYGDYDRMWADVIAKRPRNARAQNNYATSLIMQGRFAEAEPHLRVALEERPAFDEAEANLGVALSAQGRLDEGAAHLQRAIALHPGSADAHRNLAQTYARLHRSADAVAQFIESLRYEPNNVAALNGAAWILATSTDGAVRDGARARELAGKAVQLTARRDADSLDNLAVALAELGRFDEAITVTMEAAAAARSNGQNALLGDLQHRMIAYRAHQPIRVP